MKRVNFDTPLVFLSEFSKIKPPAGRKKYLIKQNKRSIIKKEHTFWIKRGLYMSGNDMTVTDCKEKIMELVKEIDNQKFLKMIYGFVRALFEEKEEGG